MFVRPPQGVVFSFVLFLLHRHVLGRSLEHPHARIQHLMRAEVLSGQCPGWESGPRSAADLKEAATHFERAAALNPAPVRKRRDESRAAALRSEAAAIEAAEAKAEAVVRAEAEAKASAVADALLAEEAAEAAEAEASAGKATGKGKAKGKAAKGKLSLIHI